MLRTLSSRFAVTSLFALTACLSLHAQAQAPAAPAVNFALTNGSTLLKSWGVTPVQVQATDLAGLRSFTLSGAYSFTRVFDLSRNTNAKLTMSFYVGYYPAGDYTFTATATNLNGAQTQRTIMVHVK